MFRKLNNTTPTNAEERTVELAPIVDAENLLPEFKDPVALPLTDKAIFLKDIQTAGPANLFSKKISRLEAAAFNNNIPQLKLLLNSISKDGMNTALIQLINCLFDMSNNNEDYVQKFIDKIFEDDMYRVLTQLLYVQEELTQDQQSTITLKTSDKLEILYNEEKEQVEKKSLHDLNTKKSEELIDVISKLFYEVVTPKEARILELLEITERVTQKHDFKFQRYS